MTSRSTSDNTSLRLILIITVISRTTLNVGTRMAYPFLPVISRGLGVPLTTATWMITARSALGLVSPLSGSLSDRYGRRVMMTLGLGLMGVGALVCLLVQPFALFFLGFLIMALAKLIYDPSMQAYLSDRVPYSQRARVLGITELPWALANLIGLPIVGFLMDVRGWRTPFAVLALISVLAMGMTWRTLPRTPRRTQKGRSSLADHPLLSTPNALFALAVAFLIACANETFFIMYGAWMEGAFGLSATGLGLIASIVGVAELTGESLTSAVVDALGKRRAVAGGALLASVMYALVPHLDAHLSWAAVGLFILLLGFEFAVVSNIPLISELLPQARGTMMAWNIGAFSAGRMIGAVLGAWLWGLGGFAANGAAAGLLTLTAVLTLVAFVREGAPSCPEP